MEYKFISEDELKESSFTKYELCDIQKSIMEFNIEATCIRVHKHKSTVSAVVYPRQPKTNTNEPSKIIPAQLNQK